MLVLHPKQDRKRQATVLSISRLPPLSLFVHHVYDIFSNMARDKIASAVDVSNLIVWARKMATIFFLTNNCCIFAMCPLHYQAGF